MKTDVQKLANLERMQKRPSKETLNHAGIIRLASGLDPFKDTAEAYLRAYKALGIDLINRVPETRAPAPLAPGESFDAGNGYVRSHLGVYDTWCRKQYPYSDPEEFFEDEAFSLDYFSLITPVPHRLDPETIRRKEQALGDTGVYYYQLYTTLFMWGVEHLGWEVFMTAAMTDPDAFDEKFMVPAFQQSQKLIETLCKTDCPFVFCHDDLADARGPVFPPAWYEKYIFPRYAELWKLVHQAGKKVIFVADGNMQPFLANLRAGGVDGVMLENPATDFDVILNAFGDRIVIGGMDTRKLTFGSPAEIRTLVMQLHEKTEGLPGFALSTPGGIHGNIPLENLEAYFDARVETGFTAAGWRNCAV
jgi:hypothetical protein